ncbi:TPA: HK97 gp10 family phage protein [Streptococcus suis]
MGGFVRTNVLRIDLHSQVADIVRKYAQQTKEDIQAGSPERLGEYRDGWSVVEVDDETAVVVNTGRNKSLTHLLELGHMDKSFNFVQPQEHIRPAYIKNEKAYLEELKNIKIQAK